MKLYKLPFSLHEPNEQSESKFMAEVPALPGCRAWGDSAAEALVNLQAVATAFIESYSDQGDALPREAQAASMEAVEPQTLSELLIAV